MSAAFAALPPGARRMIMQRARMLCLLSAFAAACSTNSKSTSNAVSQEGVEPAANPFPDAPPNAPPPAATCGDMNGGGDQHVDFPGLMLAKLAERDEVMRRQLALLDFRYDLTDAPAPDA